MKHLDLLEYLAPVAVLLALFLALGIALVGCTVPSAVGEATAAIHVAATPLSATGTAAAKTSDTLRIWGTLAILAGGVFCAVPASGLSVAASCPSSRVFSCQPTRGPSA